MNLASLYPLRFVPIFKQMLWGGQRLPDYLDSPAPAGDHIGEAWVLSDVDGHASAIADGPLAGVTLRELLARDAARILGSATLANGRFPLLLKFIDARQELSVQVHPNDEQAARKGPGRAGKTEAWVVLEADPLTSRVYAGFRSGVCAEQFREALTTRRTPQTLHSYTPMPGDCIFLDAGTVHAIGADILLFEVQQTSDMTYRLYDWDRVDAKTGQPRELHIDEGLACANFDRGPCDPVTLIREQREDTFWQSLAVCPYFTLSRITTKQPFRVGTTQSCRIIVCIEGHGELESQGNRYSLRTGNAYLLPAAIGECGCTPATELTLLECGIPC